MSERKLVSSERSQSVFSANWKQDCLLQSKLRELESSKRKVVHGIEIDQRVVNRKFQQKLFRSRLSYARMTGNREKLKELLQKDGYRFNTNVSGDDDYAVKFPTASRRAVSAPSLRTQQTTVSNPHIKSIGIDTVSNDHRPKSNVSIASRSSIKLRPQSTAAVPVSVGNGHTADDGDDTSTDIPMDESDSEPEEQEDESDTHKPKRSRKASNAKHTRFSIGKGDIRPNTAVGFVTMNSHPIHRPKTTNSISKNKTKVSGGLFDDEKPLTLLEIHHERVKAANFPKKVQTFIGSVKYLVTGDVVDYYNMRLTENADRGSKNKLYVDCVESVAEKRDALRSTGDLNARNLTMGSVNWDFLRKENMGLLDEGTTEDNTECNANDVEMKDMNGQ